MVCYAVRVPTPDSSVGSHAGEKYRARVKPRSKPCETKKPCFPLRRSSKRAQPCTMLDGTAQQPDITALARVHGGACSRVIAQPKTAAIYG